MENASKALIIAGAILLAILIISLGILIYNQAAGVVNNNAMSQVETQQFNQQYTQYEGETVRGVTVRSLLQTVYANNTAADSDDRKVIVKLGSKDIINQESGATQVGPSLNEIKTGNVYKVSCGYSTGGGDKGLVNVITISQVVATP